MTNSTPEIVSCGCDWFTFTTHRNHRHIEAMKATFDMLMKQDQQAGNPVTAQKRARFEGVGSPSLFYGERDDRIMFDTSGPMADSMVRRVLQYGDTIKATRIDAQTTIRQTPDTATIARRLPGAYEASNAINGLRAQAHTAIYSDGAGGDTFSLGAASSVRRLTIYNKSAENGGRLGPNLERFELRARQEAAALIYADICAEKHTFQPCYRHVVAECQHYGIVEPWQTGDVPRAIIHIKRKSSREKWELWLQNVVAPVVLKLHAVGATKAEISAILGLDLL